MASTGATILAVLHGVVASASVPHHIRTPATKVHAATGPVTEGWLSIGDCLSQVSRVPEPRLAWWAIESVQVNGKGLQVDWGMGAKGVRLTARPRTALELIADRLDALRADLFDEGFYRATYPEVRDSRLSPLRHYRRIGFRKGYDPHPDFDTDWYLERYPEVAASGTDPLTDFLRNALRYRRDPNPLFDTSWYLHHNPVVAKARINPLQHYLRAGMQAGHHASLFDTWYANEIRIETPEPYRGGGPHVTIVIPIYGQWTYTERCLRALSRSEAADLAQVVVVDDHGPDDSLLQLRRYPWVKVVRQPENVGYTRSVNAGAKGVQTPFILLLNNDTEPQPGFLNAMLDQMVRHSDVGLVGSRLVYGDGSLQEAGSMLWEDASGFNFGKHDVATRHQYTYAREVDYCSAASVLVRTEVWDRLGGFDESYAPAYYEDSDLAFAVRDLGLKVMYEPNSVVVHHEGKSHGTDITQGGKRQQAINRSTFVRKWRDELRHHPRDGELPWGVCSVRGLRRIQFVVSELMVTPDKDSGSRRMFEIFRVWLSQGHRVVLFCPNTDSHSAESTYLRRNGIELIAAPEDAGIFVRANADWIAAIWYSHALSAFDWHRHVRRWAPNVPTVLDTVDLHHLREAAQAELLGGEFAGLRANTSKIQEFWAMGKTDATVVVSELERNYLGEEAPTVPVYLISNLHPPTPPGGPSFEERSGLLFIGSFHHNPNPDGVLWFLDEIWPLLPDHIRAAGLDVVGGPLPTEVVGRGLDGVRVHGWVPEVGPFLHAARLSIAPLRFGGGVKGKVGEAWSHGLPVIGTSVALEGMVETQHYPMADDPAGFAALLSEAYSDRQSWERLRATGNDAVQSRFSVEAAASVMEELQRFLDERRVIKGSWKARAQGRIAPWDLPEWPRAAPTPADSPGVEAIN